MKFELLLAKRYAKGKHRFFFTFSNWLSFLGIVIGVFALLIVSSIMNGFDRDMQNRVIGTKAEIKISHPTYNPIQKYEELSARISENPRVKAVSPVCETELMIQNQKQIAAVVCHGIDYDKHHKATKLMQYMVVGAPSQAELEDDGIIIGLDLSLSLNVTVGEYVQLTSPIGTEPSPFGLLPKSKRLKVVGLFISGLPEYDRLFAYVSLQNGQYFAGLQDAVHFLEVKTTNLNQVRSIASELGKNLQNEYLVEDWSQFEENLYAAIRLEKYVMFLVLTLMIIIAAFNMTGNLIKLVAEKKSEIGILKAIGVEDKKIVGSFVLCGTIIGSLGTLFGFILAYSLLYLQQTYQLIKIPIPGFPLQWLPVEMRWQDFVFVPVIALIISLVATIYPAYKTKKVEPIRIIQNQVD